MYVERNALYTTEMCLNTILKNLRPEKRTTIVMERLEVSIAFSSSLAACMLHM